MVHGDNTGLVLPPPIAQTQVVFVPIPGKNKDLWPTLAAKCHDLAKLCEQNGVRTFVDDRKDKNPGFKYNHWELRGVPVRIEVGERDLDQGVATIATRYNKNEPDFKKYTMPFEEVGGKIPELLKEIHAKMYERAKKKRDESIMVCKTWEEVSSGLSWWRDCWPETREFGSFVDSVGGGQITEKMIPCPYRPWLAE